MDENAYSENDAGLAASANPASMNFIDYPGTYHNHGCGFSFCDGHSELRKWRGTAIDYGGVYPTGQHTATTASDISDWTYLANAASRHL